VTAHKEQKLKFVAPAVTVKVPFELVDRPYVGLEHIESWTGGIRFDEETKPEGTVSLFEINDILFGKLRPYLAKVALSKFRGSCSTEALVLRPRPGNCPAYLRYVLSQKRFIEEVDASTYGAKMPRASWEFIGSRVIPTPDFPTQKLIADFLDRETARIDQLIEKKQRQVTLLTEKLARQTDLIIFDVENGLPRQSLRWLIRVRSGDFIANTEMEKEKSDSMPIPVIGGNGIMAFSNNHNAQGNTIIIGRVGALCGNVHLTFEEAWITDNALIITFAGHQLSAVYLYEVLRAAKLNEKANKSAQPLITGEMVKAHKVAVPSNTAQALACDQISVIRNEFTRLTGRIDQSLVRLREFRAALITAAVTGQIDDAAWAKRGTTDRRLDDIEAEMTAGTLPNREKVRA
jgi:type I restriction enzyme S subunit